MKSRKINWHFFEFSSSIERTAFCNLLRRKRILHDTFYDADRGYYIVEVSSYGFHLCCALIGESEKRLVLQDIETLGGNI